MTLGTTRGFRQITVENFWISLNPIDSPSGVAHDALTRANAVEFGANGQSAKAVRYFETLKLRECW